MELPVKKYSSTDVVDKEMSHSLLKHIIIDICDEEQVINETITMCLTILSIMIEHTIDFKIFESIENLSEPEEIYMYVSKFIVETNCNRCNAGRCNYCLAYNFLYDYYSIESEYDSFVDDKNVVFSDNCKNCDYIKTIKSAFGNYTFQCCSLGKKELEEQDDCTSKEITPDNQITIFDIMEES